METSGRTAGRGGEPVRRAGLGAAALEIIHDRRRAELLASVGRRRLAEIYKGNKKTHLKALKQKTGVAFEDMLFFDDDMENRTCRSWASCRADAGGC